VKGLSSLLASHGCISRFREKVMGKEVAWGANRG
jgi:hypothetical protein